MSSWWARLRTAIPDLLAVAALLGVGIWTWPRMLGQARFMNVKVPFWATIHDLMLEGPDAGEWAASAWKVRLGDTASVDVHRLPLYPLLTGAMLHLEPDVALAGHLVNHLLMLLLPIVVYLLGRGAGGRATGMVAGLLVGLCRPLILASRSFGVDTSITFMLPFAVLAAFMTRVYGGLAVPAGLIAALASLTHFTTLPYLLLVGATVLLMGPPGWRRPIAFVLFVITASLTVWWMGNLFQLPGPRVVTQAVSEGIAPASWSASSPLGLSEKAWNILKEGSTTALDSALARMLQEVRPEWMPWYLALILPWVGVLGFGKTRTSGQADRSGWFFWREVDPKPGIVFLGCLAPLPFLAAAGAEPRYSWNLLPFFILLFVRGIAALLRLFDLLLLQIWGRWPPGLLLLVVGLAAAAPAARRVATLHPPASPSMRALAARELGEALAQRFEPGGGAVCPIREASAHAGRAYCPQTVCPFQEGEPAFLACLKIMAKECGGEGPIPYVVVEQDPEDSRSQARRSMDSWMLARGNVVQTVRSGSIVAHILSVPREEAAGVSPQTDSQVVPTFP